MSTRRVVRSAKKKKLRGSSSMQSTGLQNQEMRVRILRPVLEGEPIAGDRPRLLAGWRPRPCGSNPSPSACPGNCAGRALASPGGRNPLACRLWRFDSVPAHFSVVHRLRGVAGSMAVPQTVGGGSRPPGAIGERLGGAEAWRLRASNFALGLTVPSAGAASFHTVIFGARSVTTGSTGVRWSASSSIGRATGYPP